MTPTQLRALTRGGGSIGAHTLTHTNLATIRSQTDLAHEIRSSRCILEEVIGRPVVGFAYPYGFPQHYTSAARAAVIDAGFQFSCSARPGAVGPEGDLFEIARISAPNGPVPLLLWQLAKQI